MKKQVAAVLMSLFVVQLLPQKNLNFQLASPSASPKMMVRLNAGKIDKGTVKGIDSLTLTVEKDGNSYKVTTSASTKFRRKFWGAGKLSEISVGDTVSVHGSWVDEGKTEISARLIRDFSIQKRFGVFFGTVKTIGTDSLVMTTLHRGEQTVLGDVSKMVIGHKIRVKGLWNNTANTITEVKQIKDFSIPTSPSPTE